MNNSEKHPSRKTLVDFAQGKLEASSLDEVAHHIENCATCVEFLEQSEHDTLVEQLRQAAKDNDSFNDLDSGSFDVNQTQHFQAEASTASTEELFVDHPKYRLISQIGSGGMGAVYQAQHRLMDRIVAIKVIRAELVSNSEAVARFHNEVRAAASLSHRNIVAAYDAEQIGSSHILVMEYVVGESLAQTISRKGKLPVMHACNYVLQVAQGLKHAHEKGMIHRDIKPHNLMKTPKGVVKILDFGLARMSELGDEDSQLTSTGVMMGTADYIAPEQARNAREADIRSDLYSLGCTFYFLLAGEAPYRKAGTRVDKVMAHCSVPFPSISALREDIPTEVATIIEKLVAKDAEDRYQNPQELIDDLLPYAKPKQAPTDASVSETQINNSLENQQTLLPSNTTSPVTVPTPVATPVVNIPSQNAPLENIPVAGAHSASIPAINPHGSSEKKAQRKSRNQLIWGIGTGGGILLTVLLLYLFGAFSGTGSDSPDPGKKNAGSGDSNLPANSKTVAALFVYNQFCFGDFGPLRDRLEEKGVRVLKVSTSIRMAHFIDFADDTTPNKQNVQIENDLTELAAMVSEGKVDALVFVGGTQLLEGINDPSHANGQALTRIVQSIRQTDGWVGAIGKGVNVPYALGMLDQTVIVDVGLWLETSVRESVETRSSRVYTDIENRVITATEWRDSEDLANEILLRLND